MNFHHLPQECEERLRPDMNAPVNKNHRTCYEQVVLLDRGTVGASPSACFSASTKWQQAIGGLQ